MANNPSLDQLKRALHLHESIEKLKAELAALFGKGGGTKRGRKPGRKAKSESTPAPQVKAAKKKRVMSPEAREKIAAAQRKRWAKQKKADK